MQQPVTVPSATARRVGWALSGLTILFMLLDAGTKLALEHHTIEATTQIGYPVDAIRPIGLTLLIITVLYAMPRTAVLGAILLTGFLGGAVASKVRILDPLFGSVLFGVYLGIIAWAGLWLREPALRQIFPFMRSRSAGSLSAVASPSREPRSTAQTRQPTAAFPECDRPPSPQA